MKTLPESWVNLKLKEASEIITGSTPSTKNPEYYGGDIPFIKPGDLDTQKPLIQATQYLSTEGAKKSRLVRKGASLVSCIGNLGKVGYAGKVVATNQQINSVEFDKNLVDDRFGFYQLKTLKIWMEQEASATTISILNKSKFSEAPILLAPLKEQRRIADKLDTTLARVDALNDRMARITPLLQRFRQSVLAAATSGRLTEDWREANQGASDWLNTKFNAVISDLRYGTAKKCEANAQGIAVLRIPNVGSSGYPDLTDLKFAEFDEKEYSKIFLIEGDLLTIRSNGSVDLVGKTCVVDKKAEGLLFAGYLIRMRLDQEKINPLFAYYVISSPSVRAHIELTAKSTSGVNNINSEEVRALPLALPSLEEQTEIVRRVKTLFAFADRLEARLQSAQTAAERLTPALLAKAFRGELVPQDPNDEPAAELLRRLREARATEAPTKPKRGSK